MSSYDHLLSVRIRKLVEDKKKHLEDRDEVMLSSFALGVSASWLVDFINYRFKDLEAFRLGANDADAVVVIKKRRGQIDADL